MSTTNMNTLPADFQPSSHDVVIGKGKKFYFHAGNQWLRDVVAERINEYSQAMTKADKSNIISKVVDYVRENGRFVKLDTAGQWIYAEPLLCREKCSQTFRDNLAQTYRSSNVAKRNKRRAEQQEKSNIALSNMILYPPLPKRMRTTEAATPSYTPSCTTTTTTSSMPPLQAPSSPTSCATWFDWDLSLSAADNMEPLSIFGSSDCQQRRASISLADFDGLFADLPACDDLEPLPALSTGMMMDGSMKDYSSISISQSQQGYRSAAPPASMERRTTAAFAA